MPGIELGDLGSKIGMTSKDNGFMRFKNVKIPRFNMFSRIC
jgi:acyl-CoA oxidase